MATVTPATFHGKKLVGPFDGGLKPANGPGLYARRNPKTGHLVMANWNGRTWSKFATTPERARELAGRRSRHDRLTWFGFTKTGA